MTQPEQSKHSERDKWIDIACQMSDRGVDPQLKKMLSDLKGKPLDEYRTGLHKALDFSAHAAWTSDFMMMYMNIIWEQAGGKHDDPAPWRKEPPFNL